MAGAWLADLLLGLPAGVSVGFVTGVQMADLTGLAVALREVLHRAGWDVEEPTGVCAQLSNVKSGVMDPVGELCQIAHRHGAWVHVDGAFGLWAAASPRLRSLVAGGFLDVGDGRLPYAPVVARRCGRWPPRSTRGAGRRAWRRPVPKWPPFNLVFEACP